MAIKLIALDMDGTLLDPDHLHISPRNREALRAAAARGIKIALATGRNVCLIEDAARTLGVVDFVIAANGASVVDWRTGESLRCIPLPEEQWRTMLDIVKRRNLIVEIYADGKAFLTGADLQKAGEMEYGSAEFAEYFVTKVELADDVAAAAAGLPVEKVHIFYVPPGEMEGLMEELSAAGPMVFANGAPTNLEITAPGADKGEGLCAICARLGISPEETMAFGDGDNDLQMLALAGESFAMENGSPSAKAAAKHLAPPNSDSGVGQMIEKYVLE